MVAKGAPRWGAPPRGAPRSGRCGCNCGASALRWVTALGPGDTACEAALLGVARSRAFVVAGEGGGTTLAVDAGALAAAMMTAG